METQTEDPFDEPVEELMKRNAEYMVDKMVEDVEPDEALGAVGGGRAERNPQATEGACHEQRKINGRKFPQYR